MISSPSCGSQGQALTRPGAWRVVFAWGPVVLWTAGLFWGSGLLQRPPTPGMEGFRWDDKFQHVAAFAILAALVWRAVGRNATLRLRALVSLAYPVIYAVVDECHQRFIPTREGCLADWVADSTGALVMVVLLVALARKMTHKRAPC